LLNRKKIIVSLTTTSNRVPYLKETLSSIQAQSIKPYSIELNIPSSYKRTDLQPVDISSIPEGFNIFDCDDFGPATKLLPTLERYKKNDVLIIYCDDDRIYAPNWIERLVTIHKANGECCVADELYDIPYYVNALRIKKTYGYRLKRIASLGLWRPRKRNTTKGVILEGYGGVIVKPSFFDRTVFDIPKEFFHVDDIWFSAKLAQRGVTLKYSGRVPHDRSRPVIANGSDVGRMEGSLTLTGFSGQSRADLDLNAMRYAMENLGVWNEWKKYLTTRA